MHGCMTFVDTRRMTPYISVQSVFEILNILRIIYTSTYIKYIIFFGLERPDHSWIPFLLRKKDIL